VRVSSLLFSPYCPYAPVPSEKASASDFAVDTAGDGFSSADAQALANDTLTIANTPTTANSLGLDIQADDVGYIATVQMGTPPRDFKLLMDSGSADLWVGAEGCQSQSGPDCVSASLDFLLPNLLILTGVGKPCVSRTSVFIFICGYPVALRHNVWLRGGAR
jgi:Eukaryotic aspartyl protease